MPRRYAPRNDVQRYAPRNDVHRYAPCNDVQGYAGNDVLSNAGNDVCYFTMCLGLVPARKCQMTCALKYLPNPILTPSVRPDALI